MVREINSASQWMELQSLHCIQRWEENWGHFCNQYTSVQHLAISVHVQDIRLPRQRSPKSTSHYGIGYCSKSRVLWLTPGPNVAPLDPKTYELKTQLICLRHTQHTMMKQAKDKHCPLNKGRLEGASLWRFWNPLVRIFPFPPLWSWATVMVVARHPIVLHGSALWDTLPLPSPSLATSEEDIGNVPCEALGTCL